MSQAVSNKTPDFVLDVCGEHCPMPLLKTKLQLNKMVKGQTLKVLATDPGTERDFKSFIALSGHALETVSGEDGGFIYYIEKA